MISSAPKRVLAALEDGPGTPSELAAELELSAEACSDALRRLVSRGRVLRSPERVQLYGQPAPAHIYQLRKHAMGSANSP